MSAPIDKDRTSVWQRRRFPGLVWLGLVLAFPSTCVFGQQKPSLVAEEWKLDVVHLTRGRAPMEGLVVQQTPTHLILKRVFRRPGSPTVVMQDRLARADVARVEMLGPREREQLITRLEALARERQLLVAQMRLREGGKIELPPGEELPLKPARWGEKGKLGSAVLYTSTHFHLLSNAREDIVQLTGIQLEQIYAAFVRCLPPKHHPAQPTTIVLARSLEDYSALVRKQGRHLLNPAFYDPTRNEVVCGSDLERLCSEMEKVRQQHDRWRIQLTTRKNDLAKIYGPRVPAELLKPINDDLQKMQFVEMKNETGFRTSLRRLHQRLYHEAFHAYLASAVYPEKEGGFPIWLNEGLAQIFETALIEAGELRVGHADPERLALVRAALRKNELLSLRELLQAGSREFVVAPRGDRQSSDRCYLAAWALAFYLTFDRGVLGTRALDDYVKALRQGADVHEAFRALVDQPLPQFEKEFRHFLHHLREDGTVAR